MKTYHYLWLMVCAFFCHAVYAQPVQNNAADPPAQLKQLLQLPRVGPPLLKLPTMISKPKTPTRIQFTVAKHLTETKLLCPLLKHIPTLQLNGERTTNEEVGLKWETTNGYDNAGFDVERSLGDTLHFQKINFVWATEKIGRGDKYKLPDNNDYDETSYYRLRLLLSDGKFIYSNIAPVKGYDNFQFTVYPNPASEKLAINFFNKEEGSATIVLYDASGRIVQQQNSFLIKGTVMREISITKLASGLFTVKVILPDKQIRIGKFLKS